MVRCVSRGNEKGAACLARVDVLLFLAARTFTEGRRALGPERALYSADEILMATPPQKYASLYSLS